MVVMLEKSSETLGKVEDQVLTGSSVVILSSYQEFFYHVD